MTLGRVRKRKKEKNIFFWLFSLLHSNVAGASSRAREETTFWDFLSRGA